MGVIKKKSNNRDERRNRVCYFGIKNQPEEYVDVDNENMFNY